MDEFSFIRSIRPKDYKQQSLIKGIDDDAAVFRPIGEDVVTAVDTMVEGVHFSRQTMTPSDVGYRALAANISDLAAMGSTPAFYLVSLVVSESWSEAELHQLYEGMSELADEHGMDLIGGDTVSGSELSVSITVFGYVDKDKARYRSDAEEGDVVFVTGTLGDSRAGLACMQKSMNRTNEIDYLIGRHQRPSPRVAFAQALKNCKRVALNDVSDGIANETNEIAESSQVDLVIQANFVPTSEAIQAVFPQVVQEWSLSGGEDFELLGTVSKAEWSLVEEAASATGVAVTVIGEVKKMNDETPRVYIETEEGRTILRKSGYTHLKKEGE
ncbi:thiamine-phosphate kinase [Halobacillus locisalis]|uniref:Thiamine-monophosphate kinase n=1 Tax=Halobacillus locisalis TaxID=220753 RepID=A0A838CV67_9BACI|nr:thiamine-phosphate kinase [Halobacillus locisalis]MBA2175811.1 thiamine-phosphate kinase [Halobacillus locisalis]